MILEMLKFNFYHCTLNKFFFYQRLTHPNLYEMYAEWTSVIPSINAGVRRCNDMGCIANDSMYILHYWSIYMCKWYCTNVDLNELLNNADMFTCAIWELVSWNMSTKQWEI